MQRHPASGVTGSALGSAVVSCVSDLWSWLVGSQSCSVGGLAQIHLSHSQDAVGTVQSPKRKRNGLVGGKDVASSHSTSHIQETP